MIKAQSDRFEDALEVLAMLQDPVKAQAEANRLLALKAQADMSQDNVSKALAELSRVSAISKQEALQQVQQHKAMVDHAQVQQHALEAKEALHAQAKADLAKRSADVVAAQAALDVRKIDLDQREAKLKAKEVVLEKQRQSQDIVDSALIADKAQVAAMKADYQSKLDKLKSLIS